MTSLHTISEPSQLLLSKWRDNLLLSNREQSLLKGELVALDRQLERLIRRQLRISAFGRVGVGKSSLLNALLGENFFATDVAHGCTRRIESVRWAQSITTLDSVYLVDTPGIDEIGEAGRGRLAARVALQSDLILLVLDSDISSVEIDALKVLVQSGKPIIMVLNRCDQWTQKEQTSLIESIRSRLPKPAQSIAIKAVSAAPRKAHIQASGKVRAHRCSPAIDELHEYLSNLLTKEGELLLSLNALRQADHLQNELRQLRLKGSKAKAQGLIGRFAALKATGVAANPLLILDLAGGIACDTALIVQLCNLYGIQIGGPAARKLLKRLSEYSALLGGAQLGIQITLGTLRHLLLITAPFTGGLTLAPAAPVAIAQAALAVHTTRLTGRLAAKELLSGSNKQMALPKIMLQHIAANNPAARQWLWSWPLNKVKTHNQLSALLP